MRELSKVAKGEHLLVDVVELDEARVLDDSDSKSFGPSLREASPVFSA